MKKPYSTISIRHRFVYLIAWCLAALSLPGQTDSMWQQYHQAQHLITIAQNDSALGVLRTLDQDLTDLAGTTTAPVPDWMRTFRLLIRLERTEALFKKRDNDAATVALLELIDDATAAATHEITVQAYLRMAHIHQRQQRPRDCRKYLDLAEELTDTYDLNSLTPQLYNRSAAYHRHFGDPALSLAYAQRAMTTARELDDTHQMALAHFNLSLYYEETNPRRGEYHLQEAAEYYRNTGSASDYLIMNMVLTGLRIEDGRMKDALVVNDSALVYAGLVVSPRSFFLSRVYDDRATILKTLGRTDSAWHYLQLARTAEVQRLETASEDRATEIEAHYLAEKQRDLIARQQEQFAYERDQQQRRFLLFILGMAVVGFALYKHTRLRAATVALGKQELIEVQNQQLAQSLREQKMLQGEVHHRVKNNLQIIIGLLTLQLKEVDDPRARASLEAMSGRIYSMASVHEILYQQGRAGEINFSQYARQICNHFELLSKLPRASVIELSTGDYWFNLDTAIPLGTMFNELVTNSYKYATNRQRPLHLYVSLTEEEDKTFCLTYRDNGAGFPEDILAGKGGGLGTYLLKGMSRQLRGRVVLENDGGAVTRIYFRRKNQHKSRGRKKRLSPASTPVPATA